MKMERKKKLAVRSGLAKSVFNSIQPNRQCKYENDIRFQKMFLSNYPHAHTDTHTHKQQAISDDAHNLLVIKWIAVCCMVSLGKAK